MPRPRKNRRVCFLPANSGFTPLNKSDSHEVVILAIEEYEVIRLIDYEKYQQEECAEVMGVARTTVQKMYEEARFKIANAIVNGHSIKIEGGNFTLHSHTEVRGRRRCMRDLEE